MLPDSITDLALAGKTIFVTGGSAGIGAAACHQLASFKPGRLYLAGRNRANGLAIVQDILMQFPDVDVRFVQMDLASFDSIKAVAKEFQKTNDRLDVLMLNAGVFAAPPGLSREGYELHFATNHMGHALFTQLLMPTLLQTARHYRSDPRVVIVASEGHRWLAQSYPPLERFRTDMSDCFSFSRYSWSKIANIQFSAALANRYPEVKVVSLHPGMVYTDLVTRYLPFKVPDFIMDTAVRMCGFVISTAEQGARTQVWCCHSNKVTSGMYYTAVGKPSAVGYTANDYQKTNELWEWTDAELKRFGSPGWVQQ